MLLAAWLVVAGGASAAVAQADKPGEAEPGAAPRRSSLDERVIVHTNSANVRELVNFLAPQDWRVRFDVEAASIDRGLVFHAETTRRRALDQLCASLGLKGIFYPRKRLVLIVAGRAQ